MLTKFAWNNHSLLWKGVNIQYDFERSMQTKFRNTGFYTKGRPLVKSNLIGPSDKLTWQPGCPVSNINIQGNFCISQV